MKRTFLFTISMLLFLFGSSQPYHPLIQPDKYWTNMQYDVQANSLCNFVSGQQVRFLGDTVIQGVTYQKMTGCSMISLCQCPFYCGPYIADTAGNCYSTSSGPIFLREDTIAKKVFILDYNLSTSEQILYDFSLVAGDTLKMQYPFVSGYTITIDSVGTTILQNGDVRNIFYLSTGTFYIESIGGRNGLISPLVSFTGGSGESLGCVKLNGVWLYDGGICYVPVGIETQLNNSSVQIVFDNESQNLKIVLTNPELKGNLNILDIEGKTIFSNKVNGETSNINLSNMSSGIYLYKFECSNGKLFNGKINVMY